MERWRARVHHAVERAGLGIELRPGAEVAFDMLPSLGDDDLRRFALAGNPQFLLVEFPYEGWPRRTSPASSWNCSMRVSGPCWRTRSETRPSK